MAGVGRGIEKANKILMPVFFILFVILGIYVFFQPGAAAGYHYIFRVDKAALLSPKTWIFALGQAFFSLSVAGNGTLIYGSYLSDEEDVVKKKVMSMFTDPNHLRVEDPGQVEGNPVFIYLDAFCKDEYFEEFWPEYKNLDELKAHYQRGGLGDVKVKKFLNKVLQEELAPIRARRKEWEQKLPEVFEILKEGSRVAEAKAAETLKDVKAAMRINYFDDEDFLN